MKILLALLIPLSAHSAIQVPQPGAYAPGDSPFDFRLPRPAEVGLVVRASAPGTSWREPGAEAAVLRLELDGRYSQHLTLYMGAAEHEYRVLLGPLAAGRHTVRAVLDRALSAAAATGFQAGFRIEPYDASAPEYDAIRRAPILYARPDTLGRASDVPLVAYYEMLPAPPAGAARLLQYTWVFSNEDGGTDTVALMARWGRAVDIEHVYRVFLDAGGRVVGETFQGVNHIETPFAGKKLGLHPLLAVASRNNNFSAEIVSEARIALWPAAADLARQSREEVLDRNPWTYQVMAQELAREGRIGSGPNAIADPRNFLYLEARVAVSGAAVSFAAELKDGRLFRSDRDLPRMRIDRGGWVRSAIELPRDARFEDVGHILVYCDAPADGYPERTLRVARRPPSPPVAEPYCSVEAIRKMFFLDETWRPGPAGSVTEGLPARLAPGAHRRF